MTSLLSKHNTHQYEDSVTSNDDTLIWVSRTVTYPSNIINFFITELFNGNARHKTHCLKEHWKIIFFFLLQNLISACQKLKLQNSSNKTLKFKMQKFSQQFSCYFITGHVMGQTVSYSLLTVKDWVCAQVSPCGICSGQSSAGTDFSPNPSVLTCEYHSATTPYSLILNLEDRQWDH